MAFRKIKWKALKQKSTKRRAGGESDRLEEIIERNKADARVVHLSRVNAIISGIDRAIVHISDRKKLLNEICRVAVAKGGFKLAWIGFVAPDRSVQPAANAGEIGYLKGLHVAANNGPLGRGPAGIAIRENRPVIVNDIDHDPLMAPWRDRARQFGLHYVAAFPIRVEGKVVGSFQLYAPRAGFFDKDEVRLLSTVSDEISFALTAMEAHTKRAHAMEALQHSEQQLADFFDQSPLAMLWVGPDGCIQRINLAALKLFGHTKEAMLGLSIQQFHDDPEALTSLLDQLSKGATVKDFRARIPQKVGKTKHVLIEANGLWKKRHLQLSRWFLRDITRSIELEMEILTIVERIQMRLGQDLHDDLCQQLTGVKFLSEVLAQELASQSKEQEKQATEIARLAQNAITKTRELSHGLSPVGLEEENGLMDALQELAKSIGQIFKIECRFHCHRPVRTLGLTTSIHLYRIAQEAVNNAIKHGKARCIDISLAKIGNKLDMSVKHNGLHLPENVLARNGIGLRLMQYRAGVINGSFSIHREAGGGATVVCTVPNHIENQTERNRK